MSFIDILPLFISLGYIYVLYLIFRVSHIDGQKAFFDIGSVLYLQIREDLEELFKW